MVFENKTEGCIDLEPTGEDSYLISVCENRGCNADLTREGVKESGVIIFVQSLSVQLKRPDTFYSSVWLQ